MPNPVKVSLGERCGRLIGSLQEPSFKLRRDFVRLALLVAHAAKHVIRQFAGVSGDTGLNLLPQEVLNVFGQSNGHGNTIPLGRGRAKAKSRRLEANGWGTEQRFSTTKLRTRVTSRQQQAKRTLLD